MSKMFHSFKPPCGLLLHSLHCLHLFFYGKPRTDPSTPDKSVLSKDHFLGPVCNVLADAVLAVSGFHCHRSTLQVHGQHVVHLDWKVLLCQGSFKAFCNQPGQVYRAYSSSGVGLCFSLCWTLCILFCSFLHPYEAPPSDVTIIWVWSTPPNFESSANLLRAQTVPSFR